MKTNQYLLALAGALILQSPAFAQMLPEPGTVPGAEAQNMNAYPDYFNRCSSIVSDLRVAYSQARHQAVYNKDQAVKTLMGTLTNKIGYIPGPGSYENPNTMQAIQSAYVIATTTMNATRQDQASLGPRLLNEVRILVLSELYQIIFFAYEDLDEPFYMNSYYSCRRYSCHERSWNILPSRYYTGVAELAEKFLRMQNRIAPVQASDHVELSVSASVAKAAQDILVNSVFRRGYACTLNQLAQLEMDIKSHLNGGGYEPTPWFVSEVRSRLSNIRINTSFCGW